MPTDHQEPSPVRAGPMPCGVVPCVLPMHDVNGTHLDPRGGEFTVNICDDCGWQETHAPGCEHGCGLYAIYVEGRCVLPKGHQPASGHESQYGIRFTRGLTKAEGGHD